MAGNRDTVSQSESLNCIIRGLEFNDTCYALSHWPRQFLPIDCLSNVFQAR